MEVSALGYSSCRADPSNTQIEVGQMHAQPDMEMTSIEAQPQSLRGVNPQIPVVPSELPPLQISTLLIPTQESKQRPCLHSRASLHIRPGFYWRLGFCGFYVSRKDLWQFYYRFYGTLKGCSPQMNWTKLNSSSRIPVGKLQSGNCS